MKKEREHYQEDNRDLTRCMKCEGPVYVKGATICAQCADAIMKEPPQRSLNTDKIIKVFGISAAAVFILSQLIHQLKG